MRRRRISFGSRRSTGHAFWAMAGSRGERFAMALYPAPTRIWVHCRFCGVRLTREPIDTPFPGHADWCRPLQGWRRIVFKVCCRPLQRWLQRWRRIVFKADCNSRRSYEEEAVAGFARGTISGDWLPARRYYPLRSVRKDFGQYLERRRPWRLACMAEPLAGDTQEGQPVDEERPKARSPRSDLSDSASAASDVAAGLYFLLATSLGPESEGESADARSTSAVTCPSLDLESDAEDESVGSSAEEK